MPISPIARKDKPVEPASREDEFKTGKLLSTADATTAAVQKTLTDLGHAAPISLTTEYAGKTPARPTFSDPPKALQNVSWKQGESVTYEEERKREHGAFLFKGMLASVGMTIGFTGALLKDIAIPLAETQFAKTLAIGVLGGGGAGWILGEILLPKELQ